MTDKKNINYVDREFQEVSGGYYDDYGFYYTPNGSKFRYLLKTKFC